MYGYELWLKIKDFRGRKYGPCLKILTQITLEDENELAEIRVDNKLTLKSFFAFCSVFFFYKDQRLH